MENIHLDTYSERLGSAVYGQFQLSVSSKAMSTSKNVGQSCIRITAAFVRGFNGRILWTFQTLKVRQCRWVHAKRKD